MLDPQGFDAGKKVTGRKRQLLVDTLGLWRNASSLTAGGSFRRIGGYLSYGPAWAIGTCVTGTD
jgi:hypothetical protein